eukprot:TRINITY_DN7127_c0_g1_i3.p1 TRINITY_DN7127_c0_g1~~TRINITY_DN7127_c0_g1_i3.p1  ORF type:complete len:656 (-),score=80.01 TRINITY_DN7127_c0_g1_i3:136-2046(-)
MLFTSLVLGFALFESSGLRREKNDVNAVAASNMTSRMDKHTIAKIVAGHERAPLPNVLGEIPCEDWMLYSITEVDLWQSFEFSVEVTLEPTGHRHISQKVGGRKGNPNLHFYFNPKTTDNVKITVKDHYTQLAWRDKWTTSKGAPFRPGRSTLSGGDWWWKKSLRGEILRGSAVATKVDELSQDGIPLAEPFTALFDGPSNVWEWDEYRKHLHNWMMFRFGTFKDEESPGQSTVDRYAEKCLDKAKGCNLAPVITNGQTRVIGYDYAVRAMKAMGPQIQCNNRFRRNELGSNILNSNFWPEKPSHSIGLGDGAVDHAFVRPWFVRLFGTQVANREDTLGLIRQKVKAYLNPSGFSPGDDSSAFVTRILHKLHTFLDISDAEANEFAGRQLNVTMEVMVPSQISHATSWLLKGVEFKKEWLAKYQRGLARALGKEFTSLSTLRQDILVSGLMDSLLFAGGLSVPTVIQQAFAVLYGHWGIGELKKHHGSSWSLTEENVESFVQEVYRRWPAVGVFPSWDRETNTHTQVDLHEASLHTSGAGWGQSAMDFKLRDASEYEKKQIVWANMAMVNDDPAHPHSRVCPGHRLSINIVVELFKEFVRTGGTKCWKASAPASEIKVKAGSASNFRLTRQAGCKP